MTPALEDWIIEKLEFPYGYLPGVYDDEFCMREATDEEIKEIIFKEFPVWTSKGILIEYENEIEDLMNELKQF